ncbi:MAG: hypothetical protein QF570_22730 [Myxococcota bacterium]|jgi:hypothetical protein|nr:hypothetical protein [Myxococcota bacterium]
MSNQQVVGAKTDVSLMLPIFGSHVRRIGWARTIVGGFSMYLSIPFIIVSHLTSSLFLYQWVVRPLFGTRRLQWKDYIIIDRHRIEGIPAFDKFNCMFCGYANGVCVLLNKELDQFDEVDGDIGTGRQILLVLAFVLMIPWGLISELSHQIIYNLLVSRPLGMRRVSAKEAGAMLETNGYASQFGPITRHFVRSAKSSALRSAMALEQIESSWCPLTHFERREGIVYPDHHKHFFGPDEIEAMRQTLMTEGTVSPCKPSW